MALSSTKEPPKLPTITFIFFAFLLLSLSVPSGASARSGFLEPECLKVSSTEFIGSVRDVIDVLQDVSSVLSKFGRLFGDSRASNAISDCTDLIDLSSDELRWIASATQSPKGNNPLFVHILFGFFSRSRTRKIFYLINKIMICELQYKFFSLLIFNFLPSARLLTLCIFFFLKLLCFFFSLLPIISFR